MAARAPKGLVERHVCFVEPGLLRVDQIYQSRGLRRGEDCSGRHWVFGICELKSGRVSFSRGQEDVDIPWNAFALFLPPFSITEAKLVDLDSVNMGFLGTRELPSDAPTSPLVFPVSSLAPISSKDDIFAILRARTHELVVDRGHGARAIALKTKKRIERTYREPLTLTALSQQLGLHASQLTRYFKADFGLTPVAYRNWLRVAEGMSRLNDGEPIVSTAFEVGYNDLAQFYDRFSALTWAAPGTYKKVKKPEELNR